MRLYAFEDEWIRLCRYAPKIKSIALLCGENTHAHSHTPSTEAEWVSTSYNHNLGLLSVRLCPLACGERGRCGKALHTRHGYQHCHFDKWQLLTHTCIHRALMSGRFCDCWAGDHHPGSVRPSAGVHWVTCLTVHGHKTNRTILKVLNSRNALWNNVEEYECWTLGTFT